MGNELYIHPEIYDPLIEHLLQTDTEQVAFVFAKAIQGDDGTVFHSVDSYLVPPEEFEYQSDYHVSLTDESQARVIKIAWDMRAALVDFHSHLSDHPAASFSRSDLFGFREWVPHIWWRLKGMPLAAIVVAPSSFDALVWRTSPDQPEKLVALNVGDNATAPTNSTYRALRGADGQRKV